MSTTSFSNAIIQWQLTHGRHSLPWQQDISPYRIWLSETMLQQTQVKTVIPYFNTFIKQFPHIHDLADASDEAVMKLWAGLGYYARARNLHKTAKIIKDQYLGIFPNNYDDIIQLPGIGRSTAGAILSLAFKQSYPILDGNVKRIFARYFQIDTPFNKTKTLNQLWSYAEQLLPKNKTNYYNQGLMDLGALICTKNKPSCLLCPMQTTCQSFINQTQEYYPVKTIRKKKPTKILSFYIIQSKDHILLKKRPPHGIWGGLWSLPDSEDSINVNLKNPLHTSEMLSHQFTHFTLKYNFIIFELNNLSTNNFKSIAIENLGDYAFPKPIKMFLDPLFI
ncbi:A/G-specific adenine glycosylase [Thiotrichales bacterium 19S11-10]|nr:A/G-specific adenine glycosylase [Thiotrichales bacterium 19S11-10]